MLPRRHWHEMTSKEFAALEAPEDVVALLPLGAVEQHGPHLPLGVDGGIVEGILGAAVGLMPPGLSVLVMPTLPFGASLGHGGYPGTLGLSAETLMRALAEIGESVHRAGLRKLVVLNACAGQGAALDMAARELRVRLGMLVVPCPWWGLGLPEAVFPPAELAHGVHGGAVETSMMMHLRPDLVRKGELRHFESLGVEAEREFRFLSATGRVAFAWAAQDLNPLGACGDARLAEAGRGEALLAHAAHALVDLLAEVERFPLDALRDRV
jgi:creatinine amidohydrolase